MLRRYDAIGLLRPPRLTGQRIPLLPGRSAAPAQPGYRSEGPGLTLEKVADILDDKVSIAELLGMLRLRRAQLEAQLAASYEREGGTRLRPRRSYALVRIRKVACGWTPAQRALAIMRG